MKIKITFALLVLWIGIVKSADIEVVHAQTCNESPGNQYQWGDQLGLCAVVNFYGAFEYKWYLSKDTIIDSVDLLLHSETMTSSSTGNGSWSRSYNIPCDGGGLSGQYYLIFIADPDQKIFETNKNNNIKHNTTINISPVSSCSSNGYQIDVNYLNQSDPVNNWSNIQGFFSFTSTLAGSITSADITYYLSVDQSFDEFDDLMFFTQNEYYQPAVEPGFTMDVYFPYFSPFVQPQDGLYHLVVVMTDYNTGIKYHAVSYETIQVGAVVSVVKPPVSKGTSSVTTNPSRDGSFSFVSTSTIDKIEIFDLTGRLEQSALSNFVTGLNKGTHIAQINVGDKIEVVKLIVE
jgi:hypothetical protein